MKLVKRFRAVAKKMVPFSLRESLRYRKGARQFRCIAATRRPVADLPWGVNVYGNVGGAFGLSESCRGVAAGLQAAGIPVAVHDSSLPTEGEAASPYRVNLIHANPNHLPALRKNIAEPLWKRRYNIGYWMWEQERLPKQWLRFLPLFDELWTMSEFVADAIRKDCDLPVTVIPHAVDPKLDPSCGRAFFGLPEGLFLVLIAFDYFSAIERKNPEGAIDAFCRAFPPEERGVGLVIKARNLPPREQARLRALLGGRKNVFFLTEDYEKTAVNSLLRAVDVYVSLHRAEGFGLILAEAMKLGTPVVATDWSANTEFMDDSSACMVPARLVTLQKNYYPFLKGSRWAEPDTAAAAGFLRRLKDDAAYRGAIAAGGAEHIGRILNREAVCAALTRRMEQIASLSDERKNG